MTAPTLPPPTVGPRGPGLLSAGLRLGLMLALPVAGTVAFVAVSGGGRPVWLAACWAVGMYVGPQWAWRGWHGKVSDWTVQVHAREIVGRTGWPVRRWRRARLDQLARARSYRKYWVGFGLYHDDYLVVRDRVGGRLMVPLSPGPVTDRIRRVVADALDNTTDARAGGPTRRRLAGGNPWWAAPVGVLRFLLYLVAVASVAGTVMMLLDTRM